MGTKPAGTFKPGTKVPMSGTVTVPGSGVGVTVVKGEPMPPTPKPGQKFVYKTVTNPKPTKSR